MTAMNRSGSISPTSESDGLIVNPIHQMPRLNSYASDHTVCATESDKLDKIGNKAFASLNRACRWVFRSARLDRRPQRRRPITP
jgi:hypothetical protein